MIPSYESKSHLLRCLWDMTPELLSQLPTVWILSSSSFLYLLYLICCHRQNRWYCGYRHTSSSQHLSMTNSVPAIWTIQEGRNEWTCCFICFGIPFFMKTQAILPNHVDVSSGISASWQAIFHFHVFTCPHLSVFNRSISWFVKVIYGMESLRITVIGPVCWLWFIWLPTFFSMIQSGNTLKNCMYR